MSKRTVPDLKELFKQASEIAQQVPESMQEAAFNRAIDLLTGSENPKTDSNQTATNRTSKIKTTKKKTVSESASSADDLIAAIDSTQHPGVLSAGKVLDRSLMVLQIALNEHDIDGLTPAEISAVLTDKFRVSTTSAAVRMALGDATNLVNRVPRGKGYAYRIMGPGEEYLVHLDNTDNNTSKSNVKRRTTKKSKAASTSKAKTTKKKTTKKKSASKKGAGATGPKAAITSLIDSGYFDTSRTGPEIQQYLKTKRGLTYDTDPLRMALLRLVRDLKLERDENDEGNYEYCTPKS